MDNKQHKFYVIGAGLPRTGTLSLKAALEKILPGNCMHMVTIWHGDIDEALNCVFYENTSSDESLKGYMQRHNIVAAIDCPFVYHYKRAMRIFPHAKVILTVREPSKWEQSFKDTVYSIYYNQGFIGAILWKMRCLLNRSFSRLQSYVQEPHCLGGTLQSIHEGRGEQYFEEWNNEVKNYVPPERLLVFNVKEGWEPLCKFLDVPIPDEPFPHVNTTEDFRKRVKHNTIKNFLENLGIIVIVSGIGCLAWKYMHSNNLFVKLQGVNFSLKQ